MHYTETQQKILEVAQELIQNHYPTKENLAIAVIDWQQHKFLEVLDDIKRNALISTKEKLLCFVEAIFSSTYYDEMKMCLGGIFACEVFSLPEGIQKKAQSFFNGLYDWLEKVLSAGIQNGDIDFLFKLENFSQHLLLQIEGGLLLARLYDDSSYMDAVISFIEKSIK